MVVMVMVLTSVDCMQETAHVDCGCFLHCFHVATFIAGDGHLVTTRLNILLTRGINRYGGRYDDSTDGMFWQELWRKERCRLHSRQQGESRTNSSVS